MTKLASIHQDQHIKHLEYLKDEISLKDFESEVDMKDMNTIEVLEMTEIPMVDNDEEVIEALDLLKIQECEGSEGTDEGKSSLSLPITLNVNSNHTRA